MAKVISLSNRSYKLKTPRKEYWNDLVHAITDMGQVLIDIEKSLSKNETDVKSDINS